MQNLINRFISYVKIDTKSDPEASTCPTTQKQFDLANKLVEELKSLGLSDVGVDKNCYVTATLPSNTNEDIPTIGFIAHMDTAPDMSGKDVNPQFVENYDGSDIILNTEQNIVLSPKEFPELLSYKNQTLITTDGTTLLGADDKAGIAEIITAVEYFLNNPDVKHGTIKIGFTPDEEVGSGADLFDVESFGADFAYTVDGGTIGELEFENFNAAGAKIDIFGRNVHPGSAKNKMINSMSVAMELNSMLPQHEAPEFTEGYDGFYHLVGMNGTVEQSHLHYIIRDHDADIFKSKKNRLENVCNYLNDKYGKNTVSLDMKDQYFNMREKIVPVMHVIDTAKQAMEEVGVKPLIKPIRGGTDGARLSYIGLPCPNLFTGGHNFHGRYEFIVVESMQKSVETIVKIVELYANK